MQAKVMCYRGNLYVSKGNITEISIGAKVVELILYAICANAISICISSVFDSNARFKCLIQTLDS